LLLLFFSQLFAVAYLLGLSILPRQFRQHDDLLRSRESREMVLVKKDKRNKKSRRSRNPSDYSNASTVPTIVHISSPIMEHEKEGDGMWHRERETSSEERGVAL
jgi:hypothetical protein